MYWVSLFTLPYYSNLANSHSCMCPGSQVESSSGTIEISDIESSNTLAKHPWFVLVPFVESYPEFQLHTVHYCISITPTSRPLLAVICYSFELAHNYRTVHLSIESRHRVITVSTGNRLWCMLSKHFVIIILTSGNWNCKNKFESSAVQKFVNLFKGLH